MEVYFSRFPLPVLAAVESLVAGEASQALLCMAAESSIGDAGDAPEALEVDLNSACNGIALSTPNTEHSMGKDEKQSLNIQKNRFGFRLMPSYMI